MKYHNCHLPQVPILRDRSYLTWSATPFYKTVAGMRLLKPCLLPYFTECSRWYILFAMYRNGYFSRFCGVFKLHV